MCCSATVGLNGGQDHIGVVRLPLYLALELLEVGGLGLSGLDGGRVHHVLQVELDGRRRWGHGGVRQ